MLFTFLTVVRLSFLERFGILLIDIKIYIVLTKSIVQRGTLKEWLVEKASAFGKSRRFELFEFDYMLQYLLIVRYILILVHLGSETATKFWMWILRYENDERFNNGKELLWFDK